MKWSEGQRFEDPEPGSYVARCYAVIDYGTQIHTPFRDGEEPRHSRDVRISFELPTERMTGKYNPESKGKPFSVHKVFTASLHPKANLRKVLESWRGRAFKDGEAAEFDPASLVGVPCRVNLILKGDRIRLDSLAPLKKEEAKKLPKQINPGVFLSLEPEEFEQEVFDKLHEATREKIAKSPEFQALRDGAGRGEEPQPDPEDSGAQGGAEAGDDMPF